MGAGVVVTDIDRFEAATPLSHPFKLSAERTLSDVHQTLRIYAASLAHASDKQLRLSTNS